MFCTIGSDGKGNIKDLRVYACVCDVFKKVRDKQRVSVSAFVYECVFVLRNRHRHVCLHIYEHVNLSSHPKPLVLIFFFLHRGTRGKPRPPRKST